MTVRDPSPRRHERLERLEAVGAAVVVITVALAPLALGGALPVYAVALASLALFGAAVFVMARTAPASGARREARAVHVPLVAAPFALGAVVTALQLVPLPAAVIRSLSPSLVEDRARAVSLLPGDVVAELGGPWMSLSVDPPDTALALVRLLAALAVVVVCANASETTRASRRIWAALLVGTACVIAVAVVSRLLVDGGPSARALFLPLVNPNHNARVLGALGALLIGRGLTAELSLRGRAAFLGTGAVACTLVPLTWSRGGMATAALALACVLVVVAFERFRRRRRARGRNGDGDGDGDSDGDSVHGERDGAANDRRRARAGPVSARVLAGGAGVVMAAVLAATQLVDLSQIGALIERPVDEVAQLDDELAHPLARTKLAVLPVAKETIERYPWGVGNGAFGIGSGTVIEAGRLPEARYRHVENIVMDTLAAHGVVLGAAVLLLALFAAIDVWRATRRAASRIVVVVAFAWVVGDLIDYSLELPAPAFLVAALLGLGAGRTRHESGRARCWPLSSAPVARGLVVTTLVVAALAAAFALRTSRQSFNEAIASLPLDERRPILERALLAHPLDGHFAYQLAVEARRVRDPQRALVVLQHVFTVFPNHARAHIEAARALFALERHEQAMIEYRVAYRIAPSTRLLDEVVRRTKNVRLLRRAVPDASVAVHQLAGRLPERCGRSARTLVEEMTTLPDASQETLAAALTWLEQCDDNNGVVRVLTSWFRPIEGEAAARAARTLAAIDVEKALAMSSRWLDGSRDKAALLEWRARLALDAGNLERAQADAQMLATASPEVAVRQRATLLHAAILEQRGDLHGAFALLQESTRSALPDPDALAARARIARALGRPEEAQRALESLRRRAPEHPALR